MLPIIKHCPFCQSRGIEANHIFTNKEAHDCVDFDGVTEDRINAEFYRSITSEKLDHRQIVFRDEADLRSRGIDFIEQRGDEFFYRKKGQVRAMTPITSYACSACHCLLPPAVLDPNVKIKYVYLCGATSSGKTSTLASLFHTLKRLSNSRRAGGRNKLRPGLAFHLGSHEYTHYSKLAKALMLGKAPEATPQSELWNRQPLFFFQDSSGATLYVLVDAPGEVFENETYIVTDDSIILLMMPCNEGDSVDSVIEEVLAETHDDADMDADSLLAMLQKVKRQTSNDDDDDADGFFSRREISAASVVCDVGIATVQEASHIIMNFTQCDSMSADAVNAVMLGDYRELKGRFPHYGDLVMSRAMAAETSGALKTQFPALAEVYDEVSKNGVPADFLFTAAIGCDALNGQLVGKYNPMYMEDLLHSIIYAGSKGKE